MSHGLAQIQLAMDISPAAMLVVNPEGRIVLVNDELERLFGYERDELLGRSLEMLVPDRARASHVGHRSAYIASPELRPMGQGRNLFARAKDGTEIAVEIGLKPVPTVGGLFVLASVVDLSARRRVEGELREAQEQLLHSQKLEAIGTLAGGIAHDFNNILAAIVGYAELAARRPGISPAAKADVGEILGAAERGRALVQRILAFSRRTPSAPTPIHLAEPLEEAVRFLRASLPSRIEIRTELDPATPAVNADATQVHQILMNLATNAAHAMPEGGLIDVRLGPVHVDTTLSLRHPGLSHGPHARLVVRDNGAGMPPEIAARAFEPFFTTKAPGSGTGLGLSVIHGIVRSQGGAIGLSSEPGRGTTVEVFLPAVAGSAVIPAGEAESAERGRGEHVMVVDDEELLGRLMSGLLVESGYRVSAFKSGAEALEAFRARPGDFDIVLSDLTMPQMGGVALGEAIHAIRPEIPLVLMSGYVEGVQPAELERSGARSVLSKPVRIAALSLALRSALAGA